MCQQYLKLIGRLTLRSIVAFLVLVLPTVVGCSEEAPPTESNLAAPPVDAGPPANIEEEVLANIRAQSIGEGTFADLDIPEAFLRRITDRVIRTSYQEQFHGVFLDVPYEAPADELHAAPGDGAPLDVRIVASSRLEELADGRPPLAGFRAPILGAPAWPFEPSMSSEPEHAARSIVVRHLASEGLILTTLRAIAIIGEEPAFRESPESRLMAIGLPVDLLEHVEVDAPGGPRRGLSALIDALRLDGDPELAAKRAHFEFMQPTASGFRVATESGEHDTDVFRLQLTRGTYWRGRPHGGSVDVCRQLLELATDLNVLASLEARFADDLKRTAVDWPMSTWGRIVLVAQPLPVAQWAQDIGKPGWVGNQVATIVPRLATRREDGVFFVPGESAVADGLAEAGGKVVHSPLLFQGGNVIPVIDGTTGARVLLVGEAEIHRNRGLGLTEVEVKNAFRSEFGVDEVRVLVTPSFHVDLDVTIRTIGTRTLAFVNDREAAVRIVLREAMDVLVSAGIIEAADAERSRQTLMGTGAYTADEIGFVMRELGPLIQSMRNEHGRLPMSFVQHFQRGDGDDAIGNMHRFLLALDDVTAVGLADDALAPAHPAWGYFRSLRRARQLREDLRETLADWGWEVVAVPGWSEASRSLVPLNGIQERDRFLMTGYGGWCDPVDAAARAVFEEWLGSEIDVQVILCPETQRRSGGLHCAVVAYPAP